MICSHTRLHRLAETALNRLVRFDQLKHLKWVEIGVVFNWLKKFLPVITTVSSTRPTLIVSAGRYIATLSPGNVCFLVLSRPMERVQITLARHKYYNATLASPSLSVFFAQAITTIQEIGL